MAGGGTELRTSVVTGSARELEWCVRSGSLEIASEAGHDEVERDFPVAVEKVLTRPFPPTVPSGHGRALRRNSLAGAPRTSSKTNKLRCASRWGVPLDSPRDAPRYPALLNQVAQPRRL